MNRPRLLSSAPAALAILCGLTALMVLRQVGSTALAYPDADRLLLDGVFMLDFMRELPLWPPSRVYDFTASYYAQYPGLSIGYKPVFFPTVEAFFNAVFGISQASSRLALLFFALIAVVAYFDLVRERFGVATAFWSAALLISLPAVAKWGWYTMTELPTLAMVLLSGWLFRRYLRSSNHLYLYGTAVAFGLACWTKQVAVFAVIWLLLEAIFAGRLLWMLRQMQTYIAAGLALVLLVPLLVVTLWLGDQNIAQSIGRIAKLVPTEPAAQSVPGSGGSATGEAVSASPQQQADREQADGGEPGARADSAERPGIIAQRWPLAFEQLARNGLPPWTLALAALGALLALVQRDGRVRYFVLLAIAVYLFFGLLLGQARDRDYIYWLPAFALFAVLPFFYLSERWSAARVQYAAAGVLAAVVLSHVALSYARQPSFSQGYDIAAGLVASQTQSPTLMVDAYNNGYFTYFVRQYDEDRELFVLRADKLLSSSGMYAGERAQDVEQRLESKEDIGALMDRFGVQFIVVESKSPLPLPIHDLLREYLQSDRFRLAATIPIRTNRGPLRGQDLLVYENLELKTPEGGVLELPIPIVGQTIRVPYKPKAVPVDGATAE